MDDDEYSPSPITLGSCCNDDPLHYAFSGKLMLISVLLFFFVCLFIAFFHLHANRFLLRRARHHHRRRLHRHQISASSIAAVSSQGLDPSVLKSLPVFVYDAEFYNPPIECPVCLAEFENGETGRVLPKCNHCFHCECIDVWFQSHCSCPICRAPIQQLVKPIEVTENNQSELEGEDEVVIMVAESAIEEVQNCELSSSESSQSDDGKNCVGMIVIVAN